MRKLSFIAAAGLLVIPAVSQAKPLNELLAEKSGVLGGKESSPAKVTYNNGLKMDFGNASLSANVGLQTLFTVNDYDNKSGDPTPDNTSFDARNTRLELSGETLDGEFSWHVSNDFGSFNTDTGDEGSTLLDAYFNWHVCEEYGFKMGQYRTPSGLQYNVPVYSQQFIDRARVAQAFALGYQAGVGYYGSLGDMARHEVGVFNGLSNVDGTLEGANTGGRDNKVLGVYGISFDLTGDYDRSYEGDPMNTSDMAATLGASAYYGQAEGDAGDVDQYGATLDFALRASGASFQAEGFYGGTGFDDELPSGEDTVDSFGLYAQGGFFFDPKWEVAGRFGWISFDDEVGAALGGVDNEYEINAVVSYYLDGHNLKIQTGPTWVISQLQDDEADDLTDFRYQLMVSGHM